MSVSLPSRLIARRFAVQRVKRLSPATIGNRLCWKGEDRITTPITGQQATPGAETEVKPGGANNPHGCKGKPEEDGINDRNTSIDSAQRASHTDTSEGILRRLTRAAKGQKSHGKVPSPEFQERCQALLDQIASKQISVNQAAIEAGFRKVKSPLDQALSAFQRLSPEDRVTSKLATFWRSPRGSSATSTTTRPRSSSRPRKRPGRWPPILIQSLEIRPGRISMGNQRRRGKRQICRIAHHHKWNGPKPTVSARPPKRPSTRSPRSRRTTCLGPPSSAVSFPRSRPWPVRDRHGGGRDGSPGLSASAPRCYCRR